jgi:hypothetical protein
LAVLNIPGGGKKKGTVDIKKHGLKGGSRKGPSSINLPGKVPGIAAKIAAKIATGIKPFRQGRGQIRGRGREKGGGLGTDEIDQIGSAGLIHFPIRPGKI